MTTLAELILKADYRQIDGASTSLDRLTSTGEKSIGMVNRLAGALGVAFGVREIIEASEAYTTINNRLSLVTDSSEELAAAQQDVFEIAQKTRSPLKETAEVYQRLATNADAMGMSLAEVGDTTETINKLMVISGTSGASAAAALTQLGQAFASGTLRGEELNSVMEQAPALAKAIADGMGVTVGQLRALGQEGKITADEVVKALEKQGAAVDEQFGKMAPTIGQAMTQAGNSFINLIGKMDQAAGASSGLGMEISNLSKRIDDMDLGPMIEATNLWATGLRNLASDVGEVKNFISELSGGVDVFRAFAELPLNISTSYRIVKTHIGEIFSDVAVVSENTGKRISSALFSGAVEAGAEWDKANEAQAKGLSANEQRRESAINKILDERDSELALAKAKREIYEAEQKYLTGDDALSTKTKGGGNATAKDNKADKEKERQAKWLADQKVYWHNEIIAEMDKIAQQSAMEQSEAERRRAWLESEFATEREAEMLRYKQKLADFAEYKKALGLLDEDAEAKAKREVLEQEHQDRMAQIARDAAAKDKTTLANKLGAANAFMTNLYNATGAHSNRMTKLIQSVGAAQALVNAYVAASQALADPTVPFFAKFAAVAQVIATGMGLVNAIKGGGGSAGGGSATATTPDTSGITSTQQQQVRAQTLDIRVQSRGLWRDEDVAELMQAIGDKLGDGAKFGRVEFLQI